MESNAVKKMDSGNSVLVLVDYQARMFYGIESHSRTDIKNNVMALAKGAQILGIPTVLTTIGAASNGPFLPEIVEMFPGANVMDRTLPSFDAFEEQEVLDAVKQTGKQQVVLSGLFGVMDASGSETLDAYNMAVERMIQAGVVPCTWMQTVCEWMHDWQNPKAGDLYVNVFSKYSGYFGQKESRNG